MGQDQPPVSEGKQNKGTAGLMAKEVLAIDTLKKKLEYEFHFSCRFQCSNFLNFNLILFLPPEESKENLIKNT